MSGNDRRQRRPPRPFDRIGREMSKFGLHAMLCGTELDLLQVWNVDRPDAPATDFVSEDGGCILYVRLPALRVIRARPPPGRTTIGEFAVGVAGLAGFHPRKAQPLPGAQKLWEGYVIPNTRPYIPGTEKVE